MSDPLDQKLFPTGVSREEIRRIVHTPVPPDGWARWPAGRLRVYGIKRFVPSRRRRGLWRLTWPVRFLLAARKPRMTR